MGFTSKQDWFSLFSHRAQSIPNARLKRNSALLFSLVVTCHIVGIMLMLNNVSTRRSNVINENPLQLFQVQPEKKIISDNIDLHPLSLRAPEVHLDIPEFIKDNSEIQFVESDLKGLPSVDAHDLPSEDSHLYSDVFDPRLRKSLRENNQVVSKAKVAKLRSWQDVAGNTLIEVGEGRCIRSMPAIGKTKEKNWSFLRFKCGEDEGDRMMDNVNADLATRKNKP